MARTGIETGVAKNPSMTRFCFKPTSFLPDKLHSPATSSPRSSNKATVPLNGEPPSRHSKARYAGVRRSKHFSNWLATWVQASSSAHIGTYKRTASPPQTIPMLFSAWGLRARSSTRQTSLPSMVRASAMAWPSIAPPPIVPQTSPALETSI